MRRMRRFGGSHSCPMAACSQSADGVNSARSKSANLAIYPASRKEEKACSTARWRTSTPAK